MKKCKNCGKEMVSASDFANNDINSEYCSICMKKDGTVRTYAEFKSIMAVHLLTSEGKELSKQLGLDPANNQEEAEKLAEWVMNIMSKNVPELKNLSK